MYSFSVCDLIVPHNIFETSRSSVDRIILLFRSYLGKHQDHDTERKYEEKSETSVSTSSSFEGGPGWGEG